MNRAPEALQDQPKHHDFTPESAEKQDEQFIGYQRWRSPDGAGAKDRQETLIKRILVPTDFSPAAAEAIECAVSMANQFSAELTVVHVIDINRLAVSGSADDMMRDFWGVGSAQMCQLAEALSVKVKAEMMLVEGLPWAVIVEQSRNFDLLVLGQSPAKRGWKLFSPQTAQRVIENAACPILLVRARS
jgi:nucleotide-binding universal stress UspA family protein